MNATLIEEVLDFSSLGLTGLPLLQDRRVRRLVARNNRIRALWDEDFPLSVEEVNLDSNSIQSDGLPYEWPQTLFSITLSNNPFRSLDQVGRWPQALRVLDLRHSNFIGEFPTNLPDSLEFLNLSNTHVTHIYKLPAALKELYVTYTRLRSLPQVLPAGLEILEAGENYIFRSGLPRVWGSALRILDLNCNSLRDVPRGLPATLKILNVSRNSIQQFPSDLPAGLEFFHCGGNRILQIPAWALSRSGLRLTVQNNCLTALPIGPNILMSGGQWVGGSFHAAATIIQRSWRLQRMRRGLRAWRRLALVREDLLALAMHPDRAGRFEPVSPAWGLPSRLF